MSSAPSFFFSLLMRVGTTKAKDQGCEGKRKTQPPKKTKKEQQQLQHLVLHTLSKIIMTDSNREEFITKCHCGRVQGRFWADPNRLVAWNCDCSDCKMRQNVHLVVPKEAFQLGDMNESLDEATTLYQWGTKTAIRQFCKTCGE